MAKKHDFAGYATKYGIECTDGLTISENAFNNNHLKQVPLVWMHSRDNVKNVLGHVILHNRKDGVYCYGYFNDTPDGKHAKKMLQAGDINSMSIAAKPIQRNGLEVLHGNIYEVSLVLAGANPGATITTVSLEHGADSKDEEVLFLASSNALHATSYPDEYDELNHSDKGNESLVAEEQSMNELSKEQQDALQQAVDSLTNEQKEAFKQYLEEEVFPGVDPEEIPNEMTEEKGKQIGDYLLGMLHENSVEALLQVYEEADADGDAANDIAKYISDKYGVDSKESLQEMLESLDEKQLADVAKKAEEMFKDDETEDINHSAIERDESGKIVSYNPEYNDEKRGEIQTFLSQLVGFDVTPDNVHEVLHSMTEVQTEVYKSYLEAYAEQSKDASNEKVLNEGGSEPMINRPYTQSQSDELNHSIVGTKDGKEELLHVDDVRKEIFKDAFARKIKLSQAAHDFEIKHGITNVEDILTVETHTGEPLLQRPEEPSTVDEILNACTTSPFKTVKTRFADLTTTQARARGYIKKNEKVESYFKIWKRQTAAKMIYAKQAIDEDDVVDITDFNVISFVQGTLREMLRYEIAADIFFSDGRADSDPDKVDEDCIRPITEDLPAYMYKVHGVTAATFVETVLKAKAKHYKGMDKPTLYIDSSLLVDIKCLKAPDGHFVFGTILSDEQLAGILGVRKIVTPLFFREGYAVIVNLKDYELACPMKGKTKLREHFDIDHNNNKFLLETKIAGALNKPKSAITLTTLTKEQEEAAKAAEKAGQ